MTDRAAIVAIAFGLALVGWGTAAITASRTPNSLWWQIGSAEVHSNRYALWAYTNDGAGTWSTDLVFWPPRVQRHYMSDQRAAMLRSDDMMKSKDYQVLKDKDHTRDWMWPNYW